MTWTQITVKAKKRGHYTAVDKAMACDFSQCAVGEALHLQAVPDPLSRINAHPQSQELYNLGSDFYDAVIGADFDKVESTRLKILAVAEEV